MTSERAYEINSMLCDHALHMIDDSLAELREGLDGVSLEEMIEATRIVQDGNRIVSGGTSTLSTVCDDRMIAAIYAAYHFDAKGSEVNPIAKAYNGTLVVAIQTRKNGTKEPRKIPVEPSLFA